MIILQERTREMMDQAQKDSPHAILISGQVGAGKMHAARHLSLSVLQIKTPTKLADYPYFEEIRPNGTSISIDQIRRIQELIKLKTPGSDQIRRIIIIEDAHLMTIEAQNALLKILEEPPADTMIILTALKTLGLKETIYSRVREIPILPVSKNQLVTDLSGDLDDKAYRLSNGLPGLYFAITGSEDHQLFTAVKQAKEILGSTMFQRMAQVDSLSKQKEQIPMFLQACRLICTSLLNQAIQKNDKAKTRRSLNAIMAIYSAEAALPRNPNYKLLVTDLLLRV